MDGWIIGLIAGAVLLLCLMLLVGVVIKAASTTAQTAQAILVALEDVKASTAPLSNLRPFDPETMGPEVGSGIIPGISPGIGMEEQRGKEG